MTSADVNNATAPDQGGGLAEQVSALSAALADAQRQINQLAAMVDKKTEEINRMRRTIESEVKAGERHVAIAAGLRWEVVGVSAERDEMAARLRQAHDLIDGLAAQRAALWASTSWRVTGPLRAIGGLFKRKPQP